MIRHSAHRLLAAVALVAAVSACSPTKFVGDDGLLLDKVEIESTERGFDVTALEPYIRQKANSKWFSSLKIPLATYSLAGRDSTRWVNRTLRRMGEEPVIYDTLQARLSAADLQRAMRNQGYMQARVDVDTHVRGKRVTAKYRLTPGVPYRIAHVSYDIQDAGIDSLVHAARLLDDGLKAGQRFSVTALDAERKRITAALNDRGYFRFNKDFLRVDVDSMEGRQDVGVVVRLLPWRRSSSAPVEPHPRYVVRSVTFLGTDSAGPHLRRQVMDDASELRAGQPYSASALQHTYNNFARLKAVRFTNIRFREDPDTTLLDASVQLNTQRPSTLSFQPEGTNTAGDLGAAATLTYTNRNLLRGSEQLSISLRGAFEAIKGLDGYQDQDYQEYSIEARLLFPRFLAPFLSRSFKRRQTATSEVAVSWNLQNRPEFHRRLFSGAWRYRWTEPHHHLAWRFDLLDLNYVYMPWISPTFKHDYLDTASKRNAILRYNYEDLFIAKLGAGLTYNDGRHGLRLNVETAGNVLDLGARIYGASTNDEGQRALFNIAYAQYAKFDADYTRLVKMDLRTSLALHAALGVAVPYGNSKVLPYEKRYFAGGANSVRGWSVRELGPGKFRGTDGRIDFINQTGDMKLDLSAELRSQLFWKVAGALFIDAGNIWTLREYDVQPGGQFRLDKFYEQIAVAYGAGLRLNFSYFILRLDLGVKAINPAYLTQQEHYALFHPKYSRDFSWHFSVGLPF